MKLNLKKVKEKSSTDFEDRYVKKIVSEIRQATDDEKRLNQIVNKIYEDGFEDGHNECVADKEN